MRTPRVIRRAVARTKIEPLSAGSTVGKMKLYRKIVKEEGCIDLAVINGAGRFDSPKRIIRVYKIHL